METQTVLVERSDKNQNSVLGSSAIMLNKKYVLVTANILFDQARGTIFENLQPGKVGVEVFSSVSNKASLNVIWKEKENEDLFTVKEAHIFALFQSENIKQSSKYIFENWAVDSKDNNRALNKILSLFFVLTFETDGSLEDFKNTLKEWWYLVGNFNLKQSDKICIRSTPFGNRNFINSHAEGIISNIFGKNSCLFLSDCPSTPGSEGSPVYLYSSKGIPLRVPVGMLLSSLSWWRGEWVGLTLIADIRCIILELIDVPLRIINSHKNVNNGVIAATEFSLVQVYSGKNWGTAILLDAEKGIFISNAHVIENSKVQMFHKMRNWSAELVYRTPENYIFDLAIIKSEVDILKKLHLNSIRSSKQKLGIGDCVYSAGFPLFSKDCAPSPTLTKGCVSQSNPYMLKTTCTILPGASGGPILNEEGALVGVIVCNIKLHENNIVYPRINVAVPFSAVADIIFEYIKSEDVSTLNLLNMKNTEAEIVWKRLEGKL